MPRGFQEIKVDSFQHIKVVRLSALGTGRFTPQKIFLLLIPLRGWIDARVIVWPEGLFQWKMPMVSSEIEPATCRLLGKCINQLRHLKAVVSLDTSRNCHVIVQNVMEHIRKGAARVRIWVKYQHSSWRTEKNLKIISTRINVVHFETQTN